MALKLTTKPLSHEEQRLYLYLESIDKNTFKVSELNLKKIGLDAIYLYVLLDRLEKKGWVKRVGKGVYLRLPASAALVETIDKILFDIGVTAIKAVVNKIVTRAVEGSLAGGGVGLVAGTSSKNAKAALGATLVGALLGGIIGNIIENRMLELVSTKEHGKWSHQPYLQR